MASINSLKQALKEKAMETASSWRQPLSDAQYDAGFKILLKGSGWATYQDFIIPQLSQLLTPLFNLRTGISVLEIGPGSKSVLGYLPGHLRRAISEYVAFEPNGTFATALEEWLGPHTEIELPLPRLESPAEIHREPFILDMGADTSGNDKKYDVVLFCHSMYGMKPQHEYIEQALKMLVEQPEGGMVIVFQREGTLDLDELVCHRAASFPTGTVSVADDDETIDHFAAFFAGSSIQDIHADQALLIEWRKVCRDLGSHEQAHANHLLFSSPDVMVAFTQHATALNELIEVVPEKWGRTVKNREANLHCPASIIRPTEILHFQHCVRWAVKHRVGLTVIGGGHSGHCLWPGTIAIDMSAFDQVHVIAADGEEEGHVTSNYLIVAESGCTTGDIIRKTMEVGLTVPLGARPSVGAGLWLQGGIGHLSRQYGLACDSIIGVVMVNVDSGQLLYAGDVPSQHQRGAVRAENETELLWAIKGAGTNFGIVVSVTFKSYRAPAYVVRNWGFSLSDKYEARRRFNQFDKLVSRELPRNCSVDAYMYGDGGQLHFGITTIESWVTTLPVEGMTPDEAVDTVLGKWDSEKCVDGVGLFETEMYISAMHGGHGGGKTSSFKRCLFFNSIQTTNIDDIFILAVETRPTPLCYLHFLPGGGAVRDAKDDATAFGCRDWDFACVITGVWPRDRDETETARAAVQWVYKTAGDLLPFSIGVYGADLGPDPRDATFATKAFWCNLPRIADLKSKLDPFNVLAYACPVQYPPIDPLLVILVTGESCVGKDYCAEIWASMFANLRVPPKRAYTARISDVTKREYATKTGADFSRLLVDRAYKEEHRPALGVFFQEQVQKRRCLPEKHFLDVVRTAGLLDVLLITGMREEAPVATFSYLVPGTKLVEIRVETSDKTRRLRGGGQGDGSEKALDYRPDFIFNNDTTGNEGVEQFFKKYMAPLVDVDLLDLADMVLKVPDFPQPGTWFRHVLNISQSSGLNLCTSLLETQFTGNWVDVAAIVSCEAGGFLFAAPLSIQVDVRMTLIRDAGKLPPPVISVAKCPSYVSASSASNQPNKRIEMRPDLITKDAPVVVVDDVLSSGETIYAMLQLLKKAGVSPGNVTVMVVAEFPAHCARAMLRQRGFGRVKIQSLFAYPGK
ncbi:uncharacterized protein F4822DRAFT_309376 [Hypoxylon trugodes]|uniref:uncharacterized protein n=1 Tax=Hypoxylon trugodes TaxID=326681 RepID=UPI0021979237|nr:uncharacterized protein F4822DRAFT_309376 [Hypoxylon trugodes]KAI1386224.1 hypothetical protein F4822DRAFT_309376 [Hypoxylon trugodes]